MNLSSDHTPQLLELLKDSVSSEDSLRKNALAKLEEWEIIPGYCSLLHYIIYNKQIDNGLRFIAISCFKNVVHKFWLQRNQQSAVITSEEKAAIRSKLPELFNEENNLNATHIALLYAKIARADFPKEWPQALYQLIELGQQSNISGLHKLRVLLVLKFTVKALSTKVLLVSRTQFQRVTPDVLQHVGTIWNSTNQQILATLKAYTPDTQLPNDIAANLEACKLSLQTLKPLLVYGVPKVNESSIATELLVALLPSLRSYIEYARTIPLQSPLADYVGKFIVISCKIVVVLHKQRPGPFEPFLVPYLELMWTEISNLSFEITQGSQVLERLAVYALQYMKNVISEHYYATPRSTGSRQAETVREQELIRELLTAPRIAQLTELLISKYLCLSNDDLEQWQNDPEEFISETAADDYSYHVRPASQALFSTLFSKFNEILSSHIIELLKSVAYSDGESLQNAILRDACYQSLGYSYDDSFQHVPFQSWLQEFFMRDLNHPSRQHFMILSRRISWLLGRWVTRITEDSRPVVYQILLKLMEDSDIVIQITAAEGLANVIDDLNFNIEPFAAYVPPCVTLLFQLMGKVQEVATKMKLINHLSIIIEQSHSKIFPFARQILEYLTQLWHHTRTEDQGMMKSTIIRSVEKLVCVLEHRAADYYDILFPLVKISTDINQHESIYTLEDGMSVWQHMLQQAPNAHNGFLELFTNLPKIIRSSFEYIIPCMNILECYILMNIDGFLVKYGPEVVAIYNCLLGDLNDTGTAVVVKNMYTLVESFPAQGPAFLEDMLIKVLGLLFDTKESPLCKREYFSLLLSVILANTAYFIELTRKLQQTHQTNILPNFLEFIFEMMEKETDLNLRKRIAIALCDLLPVAGVDVIRHLGAILDVIVGVTHDGDSIVDVTDLFDDEDDEEEDDPTGSIVNERKYQLYKKQRVVQKLNLKNYALQKLQQCSSQYGNDFNQVLQSLPSYLLSALQNSE